MSTLDDLLKWQNALNQNLLLSSKEETKAFAKYKLNNGQEIEYGYGWHLKNINGIPTREHDGSIFGLKSIASTFQARTSMLYDSVVAIVILPLNS